MNCPRARFLIYAHFDRELSRAEADALSHHLAGCGPCADRAASARRLARLLHSHLDRTPAPARLRARLNGVSSLEALEKLIVRPRHPVFATAAALLLLLLLPIASDVSPAGESGAGVSTAGLLASRQASAKASFSLVSRQITGVFVCLDCEARSEAEQCPVPHGDHQAAFCADNGELWRLMPQRHNESLFESSIGRAATVEGITFPQSGFIRVSRVGY